MDSQKRIMCLLMTALVICWGMEYILAKQALEVIEPLTLILFKYILGFMLVLAIKLKNEGKSLMRKEDIPMFALCALFGEVGYFYLEYTSMSYLPISLLTVVLALVPALSVVIDKIVFKRKITKKIIAGIMLGIIGIALVIGVDYKILFEGRLIGYLLAFGAVVSWNVYNFFTASLHGKYETATLTMNQMICSILLCWPFALANLPDWQTITPVVIGGVLWLGIISTGIGFLIMVRALHVLGPTVTAIFSNLMPVSATFFGWLILKETILPIQMAGGAVVIAAGYIVIKEKGRLEELSDD